MFKLPAEKQATQPHLNAFTSLPFRGLRGAWRRSLGGYCSASCKDEIPYILSNRAYAKN